MVLNNLIITDFVYGEKPGLIYRGIVKRGRSMKKRKSAEGYNPEVELAKGANLTAAFYDKTQKITVTAGKVTVGGKPGIAGISGIATGKHNASIDGTISWR